MYDEHKARRAARKKMRDATRVIQASFARPAQGDPFLPGPTFAGPYHVAGDPATAPYSYGRFHNPTWTHFEQAVGTLETGTALVFASGMAAITAVLGTTLKPGDVVVLPADGYYTVRTLAQNYFAAHGIAPRFVPTRECGDPAHLDGAALVWIETPSNPGLDVCDIAAVAAAAHARGLLVAVDNTTATPLGQRPLELGADFSVASDTKALTGHSDLILGHVAARDPQRVERLQAWRTQQGAIAGPMEVWLAHRSLATLALRLEKQCHNALQIATFLASHPKIQMVRYPGMPGDPSHEIASRQMHLYGPIASFSLSDRAQAERFLQHCQFVIEATSFGGIHTTAERRARWAGDAIPEGFVRLSAGCEDAQDLIDDLAHALEAA
jgi:cystathionine gamma-lyase